VELYVHTLNVQALRKPLETDMGITAPRICMETIISSLVSNIRSFSGFVHTRRRHNAS